MDLDGMGGGGATRHQRRNILVETREAWAPQNREIDAMILLEDSRPSHDAGSCSGETA